MICCGDRLKNLQATIDRQILTQSLGQMEYDRIRTFALTEMGITVLRFWNEQVLKEPAQVLNAISQRLH
jgi:very-short-patch-repair endonuclease